MVYHLDSYFQDIGEQPYQFAKRFGIKRMFSRWFDWDAPHPRYFFTMFGKDCVARYSNECEDAGFFRAGESFMLLCAQRNILVHGNLADASIPLTIAELEEHFRRAQAFPPRAISLVAGA